MNATLDVTSLRARCAGAVVAPGDEGYARACLPWDVPDGCGPLAVGFAADGADVACMARAAREAGLRVVVVDGEHDGGALGDLTGTLLVVFAGRLDDGLVAQLVG